MDIGRDSFESERKKHSLDWIAQVFTDGPNTPGWSGRQAGFTKSEACYNPIAMHVKIFQEQVEESMKWDALKINCHGNPIENLVSYLNSRLRLLDTRRGQ
jgi:hypothetical protein